MLNQSTYPKKCKKLEIEDQLRAESITKLLEDPSCLALKVSGFYSQQIAEKLANTIEQANTLHGYSFAQDVLKSNLTFSETDSEELRNTYFQNAIRQIDNIRQLFYPFYSPIDYLRLKLQEVYPHGAELMTLDGQKMFCGLLRAFHSGVEAEPHQDVLYWDSDYDRNAMLDNQLAANIYLKTPEEGGELELWNHKCDSQQEYENLRNPHSYGLDRTKLGSSELLILPEPGDLILFESNRVHAVLPSKGALRITMSSFIGYNRNNQPLKLWS